MKVNGVTVTEPSEDFIVIPREPKPIVFFAKAFKDAEEFHKLCPEPQPPGKLTKDGFIPNPDDPGYKSVLQSHNEQYIGWMVIKTLEPSKIEWDTVIPDNPKTWRNWETDMKNGGFTQVECNRILGLVYEANSLTEAKLVKARELFLLGQQPA